MVDGAGTAHTQIVIGSDDVHHVDVGTRDAGQLDAVADDVLHVGQPVALAESCIARQNLAFYKLHDVEIGLLHEDKRG